MWSSAAVPGDNMNSPRYLPVLFIALAACAQQPQPAPQPLVPKSGPEGNVRVEYDGGIFNRRLEALFSVRRPAYVMVAHLGGDGIVRVLFPEDGRESGWVPGGKLYRTDFTRGDYDAAPGYWFMRPTFFRTVGARSDSYDGNGHGFVFMIASRVPLRFDRVSEFGLWNEVELTRYSTTSDPRLLIRAYANLVAPSGKYTLDYASSYSSYSTYSYANSSMDCAMMSSYGFVPWYFSGFGYRGYYGMGLPSCRGSHYGYAYDYRYGPRFAGWNSGPTTPVTGPTPSTPIATPRPIVPRPGRRDPLAPTPRGIGTGTLASRPTDLGRRVGSDRRTAPNGERVYPAPSTPYRGALAGPRMGYTSPRGARDVAPRRAAVTPWTASSGSSSGTTSSTSSGTSSSASPGRSSGSGGGSSGPPPKPVVRDP